MTEISGKLVFVTGAASGIGRGLAQELSAKGARLILTDNNEAGLAETLGRLTKGTEATSYALDVSDEMAWTSLGRQIEQQFGTPDIVVNNAGANLTALGAEQTHDDLRWQMGVNFWGVVYGTRTFLPGMIARDSGHVVNVSSIFGLFGVPSQSAYCASKFAVRGYSDSIRAELDGSGVRLTVVHPGGIKTNIVRNARIRIQGPDNMGQEEAAKRFELVARTTPTRAGQIILQGIERNKARIRIGPDAVLMDWFSRLFPAGFPLFLARRARGRRRSLASSQQVGS